MKKIYAAVVFVLSNFNICFSQITITYQQSIHPDDSIYRIVLDTANFSAGNSGTNVLWDFSLINIIQNNPNSIYYEGGANTFCGSASNMFILDYISWPAFRTDFYISDSSLYGYRGFSQYDPPSNSGQHCFTDPPDNLVFPFNYNDVFNDSSIGILQGGSPLAIWETNGSLFRHYDGFGELRLPWGIYPNSARTRVISYRKDTLTNAGGGGEVRIYSVTGYEWYELNTHGPILQYAEGSTTYIPIGGSPSTTYYKQLQAQSNIALGVTEMVTSSSFNIFPNPFTSSITIQYQNQTSTSFTIKNILGQTVFREKFEIRNPKSEMKIDLEFLPQGIYFIEVITEEGRIVRKIVKQ